MEPRDAQRLIALYPRAWRERYGDEFAALLEEYPHSRAVIAGVILAACRQRFLAIWSGARGPQDSLARTWSATMVAVFAGLNVWAMVDDSSLVPAMRAHWQLQVGWVGLQLGSVVVALALATGGLPVVVSLVRGIVRTKRWDLGGWLALPAVLGGALVGWVALVLALTGGRWGGSPWALRSATLESVANWVRWTTSAVSTLLLVATFVASAVAVARAVRCIDHAAIESTAWTARTARCVAYGLELMLLAGLVWGVTVIRYAPDSMHQLIGPLGLAFAPAWMLTVVLLLLAAIAAAGAARSITGSGTAASEA